jgi:hypothetical protein
MQSQDAAHTLREVERLRRRARADLGQLDIPLIIFGSLMLGSAVVTSGSGTGLARYWLIAAPVGTLLTAWHYRRQGREQGIAGSTSFDLAVGAAIMLAAFAAASAASAVGSPLAAAVCPVGAVTVAYLALAWYARKLVLAVIAAGLALLALALWLGGVTPERAALVLAEAGGASLLGAGIGYWFARHGRP